MKIQKIKNKNIRAQGHIEMILSFIIFAGFIFALLLFFNPVTQKSTNLAVLDLAERQILDNLSISHEKIFLVLNSTPSPSLGCFYVSNNIGAGAVVLVKDSKEQVKNSGISGNNIHIESSSGERYYVIYYNSSLNTHNISNVGACIPIPLGYYSFGLHDKDNLVLYENLISFNNSYYKNYEALKDNLNIKTEFAFSVYNTTGSLIMSGEKARPSALNLLSRNIPLLAVDRDMNRADVILNIKVWE